jgi:hypothetical protein
VIYVLASLTAIVLFGVEQYGARPQTKFIANLNGVYTVFAPYIPCLLWVLVTLVFNKKQPTFTAEKKNL